MRFLDATEDPFCLGLSPALAETVGEAVGQGLRSETWCLRRQRPYVLLGPQDLRLPHPQRGAAWLEELGLPVRLRVGGGSAVLLDEGCLSFFAAIPCRDVAKLDQNFTRLTAPIRKGCEALGVPLRFGRAPGSYCEGPQDLVSLRGRKVAGVAQALRQGCALVSGMLLIDQDPRRATSILQEFYRRSGSDRILMPQAVTSLAIERGGSMDVPTARRAILEAAGNLGWSVEDSGLSAREASRAQEILAMRRFGSTGLAKGGGVGQYMLDN